MIEFGKIFWMQRQRRGEVLAEDLPGSFRIGPLDLDLHIQASGSQDRRIDHVLAVRGTNDDHILQTLHTVDLTQQLRHDGVLYVRGHARAAGPKQRIHLVEEDDHRHPVSRLVAGSLKDQPNVPLGLTDVLVEQLRSLDIKEEAASFLAGSLADFLGQRVGHCLGDQGLATPRRSVEQYALGRLELMLSE